MVLTGCSIVSTFVAQAAKMWNLIVVSLIFFPSLSTMFDTYNYIIIIITIDLVVPVDCCWFVVSVLCM